MDLAKVVVGVLLHIVFALGLAAGGYGVFWLDRHPTIDATVPPPVRWVMPTSWKHVHFVSLAAQRDQAVTDAAQARAQLAAATRQSAARIAQAEHIAADAKASARKAQAQGKAVLAVPKSDDTCQFAKQIDQAFVGELKP